MSRLTKNIREAMARKLVAHRYTDEAKELVRLNRTLADRAYAHCYTPEIVAAMDTIEKAFPKTFSRYEAFRVNAGGFNVTLGGRITNRWVSVEQIAPVERRVVSGYHYFHNITDEALAEEVKAFAIRADGFNEVCHTAYSEALAMLNTVTTSKQLATAWAEAMSVIGDLIPEDNRTLPVVQLADINTKFGLPPKDKEDGEAKAKRKARK